MGEFFTNPNEFRLFITQAIQSSEWFIPAALLFVVAWQRFNSPPTNRSGTTFALFFCGVIFYYALIIALWLLVAIAISQGGVGLGRLWIFRSSPMGKARSNNSSPSLPPLS